MTVHWKLLAGAAGGAFLLSLLVGIVGGVGFGTLLLRALLWAIVFGGLALGADYVLRNFLPELFSGSSEAEESAENAIDITLEDENPHAPRAEDDVSPSRSVETDHVEDADFDTADGPPVAVDTEEAGPASDDDIEELEEVTEAGSRRSDGDLPSFDGVESTFASTEPVSSEPASAPSGVDVLGTEEDPEVVARAVRTLMKKDQEG
jgi:hypothetical protein